MYCHIMNSPAQVVFLEFWDDTFKALFSFRTYELYSLFISTVGTNHLLNTHCFQCSVISGSLIVVVSCCYCYSCSLIVDFTVVVSGFPKYQLFHIYHWIPR